MAAKLALSNIVLTLLAAGADPNIKDTVIFLLINFQ